jgi:hypothetical protein
MACVFRDARACAGSSRQVKTAMTAMTTSNSTKVNAWLGDAGAAGAFGERVILLIYCPFPT